VNGGSGLNLSGWPSISKVRPQAVISIPHLPKNYQISQFDQPIAETAWIEVEVAGKGEKTLLPRIVSRASAVAGCTHGTKIAGKLGACRTRSSRCRHAIRAIPLVGF